MITNVKKERNPYRTGLDDNYSNHDFYHYPTIVKYKSTKPFLKRLIETNCLDLPRFLDKSRKFILNTKNGL